MSKFGVIIVAISLGLIAFFFLSGGRKLSGEKANEEKKLSKISGAENLRRQGANTNDAQSGKNKKQYTNAVSSVKQIILPAAEEFGKEGNSSHKNLSLLAELVFEYDTIVKEEGLPTGMNEDFVDALTGKNYRRLQVISLDHPRIDEKGRLIDNWGQPYFFHSESTKSFQIRCSGPDRELFTEDDILKECGSIKSIK